MSHTFCDTSTANTVLYRHSQKERVCSHTQFYHHGFRLCRKTFLFLHKVGEFHFKAIKSSYLTGGLVPRVHKHKGRVAPNAVQLDDMRAILTFVMQYAENNAILLPGRIPGYKRDDIQLLPCTTAKRAVWRLYQESAELLSLGSLSYSFFCQVRKESGLHTYLIKTPLRCGRNSSLILLLHAP